MVVSALLSKSSESNTFIKEDVEKSLSAVASHVNCVKAMGAFINGGAGYVHSHYLLSCLPHFCFDLISSLAIYDRI